MLYSFTTAKIFKSYLRMKIHSQIGIYEDETHHLLFQ